MWDTVEVFGGGELTRGSVSVLVGRQDAEEPDCPSKMPPMDFFRGVWQGQKSQNAGFSPPPKMCPPHLYQPALPFFCTPVPYVPVEACSLRQESRF